VSSGACDQAHVSMAVLQRKITNPYAHFGTLAAELRMETVDAQHRYELAEMFERLAPGEDTAAVLGPQELPGHVAPPARAERGKEKRCCPIFWLPNRRPIRRYAEGVENRYSVTVMAALKRKQVTSDRSNGEVLPLLPDLLGLQKLFARPQPRLQNYADEFARVISKGQSYPNSYASDRDCDFRY
jgi:hypothetical protein